MSTQRIIIIIAVLIVFALAVGSIRSGPRLTEIDRTVRKEKDSDDA